MGFVNFKGFAETINIGKFVTSLEDASFKLSNFFNHRGRIVKIDAELGHKRETAWIHHGRILKTS